MSFQIQCPANVCKWCPANVFSQSNLHWQDIQHDLQIETEFQIQCPVNVCKWCPAKECN